MRTYGKIVAEGLLVILLPLLWAALAVLLVACIPLYLIGLFKRGVVAAITGGDPLVP